jgi:hypothetical protein
MRRRPEIASSQIGPDDANDFIDSHSQSLFARGTVADLEADNPTATQLDSVRQVIPSRDVPLFDLLRSGTSFIDAADLLGISGSVIRTRLKKWAQLARKVTDSVER